MSAGRKQLFAHAAWLELNATGERYQAAVLKGQHGTAEELRRIAHKILDDHLDARCDAALAAIALIDPPR